MHCYFCLWRDLFPLLQKLYADILDFRFGLFLSSHHIRFFLIPPGLNSNRSTTTKISDKKIYSQWYDVGRSYSFCRFSIKLCSLKLFFSTKILDINTNYFGIIFYSRQPICIYISYHFSKYKSITVFVCKIVFFLMHK